MPLGSISSSSSSSSVGDQTAGNEEKGSRATVTTTVRLGVSGVVYECEPLAPLAEEESSEIDVSPPSPERSTLIQSVATTLAMYSDDHAGYEDYSIPDGADRKDYLNNMDNFDWGDGEEDYGFLRNSAVDPGARSPTAEPDMPLHDQIMAAADRAMHATQRCVRAADLVKNACLTATLATEAAINANNSDNAQQAIEMATIAVDTAIEAAKEADEEANVARKAVVDAISKEKILTSVSVPSRVLTKIQRTVSDTAKAAEETTDVAATAVCQAVEVLEAASATAAFISRAEK